MTVNYTTNLALGQPVTGTESGTWGDDVNNAVTSYLDIAIAGGLATTITTADVTLTLTQGTSAATNISSTTAQYAIINVSGAKTAARSLIVPSSSRHYVINNAAATGGFLLTVKGLATTGVTLVDGEKAIVAWNGTDYVKIVSSAISNLTGTLPVANGGTGLTAGTSGGVPYYSSTSAITSSALLTASALMIGGGAGAAPATTTTGAGVVTALGVNVGSAGAVLVNGGVLGTPSSGTVTNLTGTASININGTVGATTASSGAFTTITATTSISISSVAVPTISSTSTLTNKWVQPRVLTSTANSATPTLNTDSSDMIVITGQSVAITSFTTNLTGTPVNGQKLIISITGTGAIAITWGASFESSTVTLPSTTVTTARLDIGFIWNVATSKWRCVASA